MSDAIAVARLLEMLPADALVEALNASETSLTHTKDVFDAAELLDRDSAVDARLRWITRPEALRLRELANGAPVDPENATDNQLRRLVLVDADGRPLDRVIQRTAMLSDEHDSQTPTAYPSKPSESNLSNSETGLATSARRGIAATRLVYGLLIAIIDKEPHVLGRGGIARADKTRLAEFLGIGLDTLTVVAAVAETASLLAPTSHDTVDVTQRAHEWMLSSDAKRLSDLVTGWRDALPAPLREAILDSWMHDTPMSWWGAVTFRLPFGDAALEEYRDPITRSAQLLGLAGPDGLTALGQGLLGETERFLEKLAPYETPTIDYVYPQADNTIIAPGILRPEVEAKLRTCAHCVQFGDASVYALTQKSLAAALSGGLSAEALTAFLDSISRGGLPQPLRYLIDDTASRFGEVRVETYGSESHIHVANPTLAATLIRDRALIPLALQPDPDAGDATTLFSRLPAHVVANAIAAARYSVLPPSDGGYRPTVTSTGGTDAGGAPARIAALFPNPDPDPRSAAAAHSLAAHIHAHVNATDASTLRNQHLARMLELAVKKHTPVRIVVTMPDTTAVEFELEPTGLSGGRLRGRDTRAQTERTLPINRISVVEPIVEA